MATYKTDVALISATQFNVAPVSVDDGAGVYGVAATASTGDWVLGSAIPDGRKMLVIVNTGAIANAPTALKVSLHGSATDANGTNGAEIAATVTEWATPPGDTCYMVEIDMSHVSDLTKYYSLALTCNGAGTATILAGASGHILDPAHKA
jgi:hypothetical protein